MFKIFTALSENKILHKQVQSLKIETQQLNDTLKALNKELTQTRETLGKTQIRHAKEMQKYVEVEARMQKAKQAYKALRTQEQEKVVEIQAYQARIANLEAELATLQQTQPPPQSPEDEKTQALAQELTETQEKYLDVSSENQKLREEIQQLQEKTRRHDKSQRTPQDKKILIVDDSITTRTLMKKILESADYEVHLAKDGTEGKAAIETTPIDIVVTDAEMPNMNGFELIHWIKNESNKPEIPVIMIASMADQEIQAKAETAGANSFITKNNFHQQVFLDTIEKALYD